MSMIRAVVLDGAKTVEEKSESKEEKQEFSGSLFDAIKTGMGIINIQELIRVKKLSSNNGESKREKIIFNINAVDEQGHTVLHYAILKRRDDTIALIKLLLEQGADPRTCNAKGQNLLEMAAEEVREAATMLFLFNAFPFQCTFEKSVFIKSYFQKVPFDLYPKKEEVLGQIEQLILFNTVPTVSFYAKFPEQFFTIVNHSYCLAGPFYRGKLLAMLDKVMEARVLHSLAELSIPVNTRSVALSYALAASCHPEILRYFMTKGADPRDLITCYAGVSGAKKAYRSNMLLIALSKANAETIRAFLDAFPLQCLSLSHIPFALQAQKIMQCNKKLTEEQKNNLLSRVTELESYMTQIEKAIHFGLPTFIQIIERAHCISLSFYHEEWLGVVKNALRLTTDVCILDQLHMLEGKLLYNKYNSDPSNELKTLAAAFIAWSAIQNPKNLTPQDNLLLGKLLLSVETDANVLICTAYTNYYQQQEKSFSHLRLAKAVEEKSETKSVSMTNSLSLQTLNRMGWAQLDIAMWKFLCFLIKNNLLGKESSSANQLYCKIADLKLKAEKDTDGRFEHIQMISIRLHTAVNALCGKSPLTKFPAAKDVGILAVVKQLQESLDHIYLGLRQEVAVLKF